MAIDDPEQSEAQDGEREATDPSGLTSDELEDASGVEEPTEHIDPEEVTVIIHEPEAAPSPAEDEVTRITHAVPTPVGDEPTVYNEPVQEGVLNGPGPVHREPDFRPGTSGLSPICLEDEALLRDPVGLYKGEFSPFYPLADRIRAGAASDPFTPPPRVWTPPEEDSEDTHPEAVDATPRGRSRSSSGFYVSPPIPPPAPARPLWQSFSVAFLITVALSLPAGYGALASGHLRFLTPGGTVTPEQIENPPSLAAPAKAEATKVGVGTTTPTPEAPAMTPCAGEKEWGRRDVRFQTWRLTLSKGRTVEGVVKGVQDCALQLKMDGAPEVRLIPFEDIVSSESLGH